MKWHWVISVFAGAMLALVSVIGSTPTAFAEPRESSVNAPLNTPYSSDGITYTITSASLKTDIDDSVRLDLGIKADVGDGYGLNFWDASFRLQAGDDSYAPVSGLNETIDANSSKSGTISFVVPDTTTASNLVIDFPNSEVEVPITLDAEAIAETGSAGGDGVTVPLNTPFSSGDVTYMITSATATADANDSISLDLAIKATAGDGYGLNFWDASFRLTAGSETYSPTSNLNEVVEADSTKTGTVSFLVPDTTTEATLVISFADGDKSVPVTFDAPPSP